MEQWVLTRKGADFEAISKKYGISKRLAALIRNREVIGEEAIGQYLNGTVAELYDAMLLKDMNKAIDILKEKIQSQVKIRVIGDYDIDGVNATYILTEGIERAGGVVDSDIPDRIKDGYGLNIELIERAYKEGIDTIITCDNGIAALEEVAYGKRLGMTIIVTDHHEVPFEETEGKRQYRMPEADAVIDPKRTDCEYPFKGLCGAAVAYKLAEALYESMGNDADELDDLLENAAIATIGDVMDLTGENRILVKEGLERLRRTTNPGLSALIECTGIDKKTLSAYHIGFVLGPCLNAGGRLDTAKRALDLLRAKTKKEADLLAGDLKALNDSRKEMTNSAIETAKSLVETTKASAGNVLVLYLPDCHESIAGIVAGRIRECYYKPVYVITDAEEGLKGSGRSIEAYHMYEEMNKCGELLTRFGGHKLAAGFSLKKENLEPFRQALNEQCTLEEKDMQETVVIDMELPFSCVTESFVIELKQLEPFGKGNQKPVFAERNVDVISARIIGKNKNVYKLQVRDAKNTQINAMFFGDTETFTHYLEEKKKEDDGKISITYYPDVNEYMGKKEMQIIITHYR